MKRQLLIACAAIFFLLSCADSKKKDAEKKDGSSEPTVSQADTGNNDAWVPVDSATSMKNMIAYGTPGPMHAMMSSWSGTWEEETTMWSYDGADAQHSKGTAVNTMMIGGKYQSSKHTGEMMGMPFEGMSIIGYDNATKLFNSSWIDNWGSGIMKMEGPWDEANKTITLTGTMPDLDRPGKLCHFKEVFKIIDDNTQHMEMYGPDPKTGKEYKTMEMKLTRKK